MSPTHVGFDGHDEHDEVRRHVHGHMLPVMRAAERPGAHDGGPGASSSTAAHPSACKVHFKCEAPHCVTDIKDPLHGDAVFPPTAALTSNVEGVPNNGVIWA